MNPITHLLIGWKLGSAVTSQPRERAAITWAGVAADTDGFGALVDLGNRLLGRPETAWYGMYHHSLFHGLFGAVLAAGTAAAVCRRRALAAAGAFLAFHLHLVCDLAGSRGPSAGDVWPIHYLAPFSEALTVSWAGQWPLNGWPNVLISLVLLAAVFLQAAREGVSPVSLFSRRPRSVLARGCTSGFHCSAAQLVDTLVGPQDTVPLRIVERLPCQEAHESLCLNVAERGDESTKALDLELFVGGHGSVLLTKAVGSTATMRV